MTAPAAPPSAREVPEMKKQLTVVIASVSRSGASSIYVGQCSAAVFSARRERVAAMQASGDISEYQASAHDTIDDVEACLMSMYGIAWYNRARKQINALREGSSS